jgi:hypothetical protein
MDPQDDPEARIRQLEQQSADYGAVELGADQYSGTQGPTPTTPLPPPAYGTPPPTYGARPMATRTARHRSASHSRKGRGRVLRWG